MKERMISRGDLFYYDFGERVGSVQSGERPVLVVQADDYNKNAPTVIVAAVTSVIKKRYLPSHIILGDKFGLKKPSMVLLEQVQTVNKDSFYRIPKLLFTNDYFKALSNDAKILYGLMLDRMSLSMKNQWFDEENKAYIYFSVEDIMELLNCGKNKAVKTMQELDRETGIGLIEKKRQGLGKANIIYVKNFVLNNKVKSQSDKKFMKQTKGDKDGNMEVYKSNFSRFEKQTSRIPQDKLQEVRISNSNNNKFNDTYRNNIKSVHIPSEEGECKNRGARYEGIDDYAATKELIKEHIEYNVLMQNYPSNQELVQGIFELILETVLYTGNKVIIASNEYPAEIVKNRFMKINYMHIQYVMECLRKNTTQVKNIKKYLLAALFNAPVTMQGYYQAEVNHAMPQFANNK